MRRRYVQFITATALAILALTPALLKGQQSPRQLFERARIVEEANQDLMQAVRLYQQAAAESKDRSLAAQALLRMADCYEKLGNMDARKTYERILKEFPDEKNAAAEASRRLAALAGAKPRDIAMKVLSGNTMYKRPSPDGRYLVGATDEGLMLFDVVTRVERRLTSDGTEGNLCFTPDGRRVIYAWSEGDRFEIRSINLDGSKVKTHFSTIQYRALEVSAISPNGKLAAVGLALRDGQQRPFWQIGLVTLDTGELKVLRSLEWRDTYAGNFSPDGRWLVYSAQVSEDVRDLGIFIIAVDGSAHHTLVDQPVTSDAPFFTPDGSRVVYVSGDGFSVRDSRILNNGQPNKTLYAIRVRDGKPLGPPEGVKSNLSSGFYSGAPMGFSRDGSFYFRESEDKNLISVVEIDPGNWKPKTAPAAISDPFRHRSPVTPAWSPNGKRLAFLDNYQENILYIHELQSGSERTYPTNSTDTTFWGWQPDGKSVLLNGTQGMKLVDVESMQARPVPLTTQWPLFSNDGKSILHANGLVPPEGAPRGTPRTMQLIQHDIETGAQKVLYSAAALGGGRLLALSPDGRFAAIAFFTPEDRKANPAPGERMADVTRLHKVVPLDGGEPLFLASVGSNANSMAFTQDSSAILFLQSDEVWVQRLDGSPAYATGLRKGRLGGLSLSADGTRLAFSSHEITRHVWSYRNLFQ